MCWLSTSYERKTLPHLALLPPRPLHGPERADCDPFSMCQRYQAVSAERKTPGQRFIGCGQLPDRAPRRLNRGSAHPAIAVMPGPGGVRRLYCLAAGVAELPYSERSMPLS
jgi:hypothetical protein